MWLEGVAAVAVAIVVISLPGASLALALRQTGLPLWALAPPLSLTVFTLVGEGARLVGLPWGIEITTAVIGASFLLVAISISRQWRRGWRPNKPAFGSLIVLASLAVAAILIGAQLAAGIGSFNSFSQTFDNIFHLNGVRYILDQEQASSLTLGGFTRSSGEVGFYPAGWHTLVSVVVLLSGASIPVATNALTLVVAALVWPAGILWLGRICLGSGHTTSLIIGIVAASVPTFPLLPIYFGVLYPFLLSTAFLPATLALTSVVLISVREATNNPTEIVDGQVLRLLLIVTLIVPALMVSHTSAVVVWLVGSAGIYLVWLLTTWFLLTKRQRWWHAALFTALLFFAILAFALLRPVWGASPFAGRLTALEALTQLGSFSIYGVSPNPILALLSLAGLTLALTSREMWVRIPGIMFAVFAGLFIAVASMPDIGLRYILVGTWYQDTNRVAALLAIPMTLVVALAADRLLRQILKLPPIRGRRHIRRVIIVIVLGGLIWAGQSHGISDSVRNVRASFALTDTSALLTNDELALVQRLPESLEPGARILVNPWFGGAIAYALMGFDVSSRHIFVDPGREVDILTNRLVEAQSGGELCNLVNYTGFGYVLDFGGATVIPDSAQGKNPPESEHRYRGLRHLEGSSVFELIDAQGEAKLFKIVGCDK